ncbi:hypothetical protein SDC9_179084 [bioreactor metagenome]|uniref:Uncharacterized protein n=1 Tax=bioreactor metagenome TaxID=1076179 RepID=A0A645GYX5_9ZZZZ
MAEKIGGGEENEQMAGGAECPGQAEHRLTEGVHGYIGRSDDLHVGLEKVSEDQGDDQNRKQETLSICQGVERIDRQHRLKEGGKRLGRYHGEDGSIRTGGGAGREVGGEEAED